jgi:steroid delta-isomerase-like uncharacterized protein
MCEKTVPCRIVATEIAGAASGAAEETGASTVNVHLVTRQTPSGGIAMSTEQENEAMLRAWFEEVWNQKQPEEIPKRFAPDGIAHGMGPNGTDITGPSAFQEAYHVFTRAFPDLHVTVDQAIASGDRVAVHLTCEGTHGGDDLGVGATGKPVRFTAMTIARFREGKIIEGWNVIDLLAALRQIGAVPAGEALP